MAKTSQVHAHAPGDDQERETGWPENTPTVSSSGLGRAIVVDDDALVRVMLADALESHGFEVLTAPDGLAGLQLLTETILTVKLLVTDMLMPCLDGIDLVRTIRKAGGESELAIVVVTSTDIPFFRDLLFQAGADLVLQKSLGPEAIAWAAEALLERPRATRWRRAAGRAEPSHAIPASSSL